MKNQPPQPTDAEGSAMTPEEPQPPASRRRYEAPAWYRGALKGEERLLRATIGRRLRRRDADVPTGGVTNRVRHPTLGHVAAERLLPGVDAPAAELEQHVARYTWAFRACEGKDVLDVGCGVGYGTSLLSWVARSATGMDRSLEAIESARATYRAENLAYVHDRAEGALPTADVATCFEVIEHVDDPAQVCVALLQAAPRVLISYPNPFAAGPHLNPHHVVDWPLRTMRRALRDAGATQIRGYHQTMRSPSVKRGTPPWAVVWVLDAGR
jgi:2-polyprenyl-3-methyl-5-hydroxy-6-metoxy-1,4-benzoquinol methylase